MTARRSRRTGGSTATAHPALLALLVTLTTAAATPGCQRSHPDSAPPVTAAPTVAAAPAAVPSVQPDAATARPEAAVPEAPRAVPPNKPAGVPAEAFWVGGPDGGVFVRLERTKGRPGTYAAKIFHPYGEVWYAGPLVAAPPDASADIDPSQHDQFAGWDGERLLLGDGRWLDSVKAKRTRAPRGH